MIITACLSFFDETPELLAECVARLGAIGVDQLIAVDGPYALYPHVRTRSSSESIDAIHVTARKVGINEMVVYTSTPWEGNEVGKRQRMLTIARGEAPKGKWKQERAERDWLLVVDADHFWESDDDLHKLLVLGGSALDGDRQLDFARVSFAEVFQPDGTPIYAPARPLMRARRDLRMGSNHYTYLVGSDEPKFSTFLERPTPTEPALDLTGSVRVVHRVHDRDPARRGRQACYYGDRDRLEVER